VVNVPFDWSALRWYAVNDPPATIDREIENNLVETSFFFTNPEWRAFMLDLTFTTLDFLQYDFIDTSEEIARQIIRSDLN